MVCRLAYRRRGLLAFTIPSQLAAQSADRPVGSAASSPEFPPGSPRIVARQPDLVALPGAAFVIRSDVRY